MRFVAPIVAMLLMVGLAGCRDGDTSSGASGVDMAGQTVSVSNLLSVASGLCDAADLAGRNPNSSKATFYGQSHDGLHLIARGLEKVDRNQAAALLEAKQKVETDYLATPPGPQLAGDLRNLAEVTRASLLMFDVKAAPCPSA